MEKQAGHYIHLYKTNIPCRPREIASSKRRCHKDLPAPRGADNRLSYKRWEQGEAINSTAISPSVIN